MPRQVAFLIYPDFQLLDAAGPIAAFEIAERYRPGSYLLRIVAPEPGSVTSSSGVSMHAGSLGRTLGVDTLVVAGGEGSRTVLSCPRTRRFIRSCARRARRTGSVCSGAYLLAAAGILDGKHATTHWSCSIDFARRFPRVHLEPDRIYIKDGAIWTSAGITAGIDLALALIEEDLGEAIARQTAQQLVVYFRRPGGQSQFSALLDMERANGRFAALLDHVRSNLGKPLTVAVLADRACMSPRHFSRAFHAETGMSPAKAVEQLRAEAARGALGGNGRSIHDVARAYGFGNAERMRRTFLRLFGVTPSALKHQVRSE
ncbi:MAG TPA: GlxA family transcriptional regulator [Steroidobacteraceae bacterium]|jgi:transcriptional regulator GlxA family with amidase domain